MAQALGRSVNGENYLPIAPMLSKISKQIKKDTSCLLNDGVPFMSYEVEIKLTKQLKELQPAKGTEPPAITLADNEYIYWEFPFDTITEEKNKRKHQG